MIRRTVCVAVLTALALGLASPARSQDLDDPVTGIERSLTLVEQDLAGGRTQAAAEQLARVERDWKRLPRGPVAFVRALEIDERIARLRAALPATPAPVRPAPRVSQARIDRAIQRGRAALRAQQRADGTWRYKRRHTVGATALALLALLAADVPPGDAAMRRGLAYLRRHPPTMTYHAALVCMMLQALSRARAPKGKARERACWLDAADTRLLRNAARAIGVAQHDGAWSYVVGTPTRGGSGITRPPVIGRLQPDHSNTQYAVLGLRAAAQCGITINPLIWTRALTHLLRAQRSGQASAGWGYRQGGEPTVTMTSACVAAVLVAADESTQARALEPGHQTASASAVRRALAWLAGAYPIDPQGKTIDGYLLYGIERVGVLARIARIGQHDWYQDGAALYLARQASDGSWDGRHQPAVETAFALLFLRRATVPTRVLELSRPTPDPPK